MVINDAGVSQGLTRRRTFELVVMAASFRGVLERAFTG